MCSTSLDRSRIKWVCGCSSFPRAPGNFQTKNHHSLDVSPSAMGLTRHDVQSTRKFYAGCRADGHLSLDWTIAKLCGLQPKCMHRWDTYGSDKLSAFEGWPSAHYSPSFGLNRKLRTPILEPSRVILTPYKARALLNEGGHPLFHSSIFEERPLIDRCDRTPPPKRKKEKSPKRAQ